MQNWSVFREFPIRFLRCTSAIDSTTTKTTQVFKRLHGTIAFVRKNSYMPQFKLLQTGQPWFIHHEGPRYLFDTPLTVICFTMPEKFCQESTSVCFELYVTKFHWMFDSVRWYRITNAVYFTYFTWPILVTILLILRDMLFTSSKWDPDKNQSTRT